MIDHINIPVSDLSRAKDFYDIAFKALDIQCVAQDGPALGYGTINWECGIVQTDGPITRLHVAFSASSQEQVSDFHYACLSAGGECNGPPGYRPEYGTAYFAAFVIDPDGHNIEAVFRG